MNTRFTRFIRLLCLLASAALLTPSGVGAAAPAGETKPRIVMLIAEPEYDTSVTLPAFAAKYLKEFHVVIANGSTGASGPQFENMDKIEHADVLLVSVRRVLPTDLEMGAIKRHLAAGKAVVGIRTASHAFSPARGAAAPEGRVAYPEWDAEVIGGNYTGHYGRSADTRVEAAPEAPEGLLRGVTLPFISKSWLYRNTPLRPGAHPVLLGSIPGEPSHPVAWTFVRSGGGRTFYTSLGHAEDFANPQFCQLLLNGIQWSVAGRSSPVKTTPE